MMIEIRYIHPLSNDPELAAEWHVYHLKKPVGVLFSQDWADRIKAGIKLLEALSKSQRKSVSQIIREVNGD